VKAPGLLAQSREVCGPVATAGEKQVGFGACGVHSSHFSERSMKRKLLCFAGLLALVAAGCAPADDDAVTSADDAPSGPLAAEALPPTLLAQVGCSASSG
jgi:hypothetical protein